MANQELRCDAVIIGGGLAGLAAGIRLRKLGRYPIVLEAKEDELYANNTRWGGRGAKCVEGTARELARRVGEHKVKGDQRACFPHDACV